MLVITATAVTALEDSEGAEPAEPAQPFPFERENFVVDPVDISLVGPENLTLNKSIYIRMSSLSPQPTWACVYLDTRNEWSTQGVRLVTQKELDEVFGELANLSGTWRLRGIWMVNLCFELRFWLRTIIFLRT